MSDKQGPPAKKSRAETETLPLPSDESTDATLAAPSGGSVDATLAAPSDGSVDATLMAPSDGSVDATLAAPSDESADETLATPFGESTLDGNAVTLEAEGRYASPRDRDTLEIGRGGIGRVLVVMDRHLGREIAVKELLTNAEQLTGRGRGRGTGPSSGRMTSPTTARFLREARVTGQLEHPNIVPVYELGQRPDGTLYYAMKLVRGRTLSAALDRCHSLTERLDLLPRYVDLCQAIAYAHSRGVIHRDIKTENVMLGEFGETVVLDWGLAKVKGQEDLREQDLQREVQIHQQTSEGQTVAGAAMGTPAYMSPEQARGDLESIDKQSDVWSLGAVLYELLTGRPPHTGRTVHEVLRKVTDDPVTPVLERAPQVPPELAAVAQKALVRDRARRYASAQELAHEIEAFQSGARVSSYEYSSWELLQRFILRNKALSTATAVLVLVLAVATVLVYRAYRGAERARAGEVQQRRKAVRSQKLAQSNEREAHLHLAVAFQEKADRLLGMHNFSAARIFAAASLLNNPGNPYSPHHRKGLPKAGRQAARSGIVAAQSALFTARMYQAFHLKQKLKPRPPGDIWAVAFFPDGKRLATASKAGRVHLWSVPDGKPLGALHAGPHIMNIAVSPNGRLVAGVGVDGTARLWNVKTKKLVTTLLAHRSAATGIAFSPDGQILATCGLDGFARLWDVNTGKKLAALRHKGRQVWALAFSPDGGLLATTSWAGSPSLVTLWDVKTRSALARMAGHMGPAWTVAFSRDGKELASGGVDKSVRLWSVAQKRQIANMKHHRGDVTRVVYPPQSNLLVSVSVDRSVALWLRPLESVIASHKAHRNHIWSVDISPDGTRVATGSLDGEARLWDFTPDGRVKMIFSRSGPLFFPRYTRDGEHLLAPAGKDVALQSPLLQLVFGRLKGHTGWVKQLALSPKGRWVATASADTTARIWELSTRRCVAVLRGHPKTVRDVAFSPDGKLLATAGADPHIRLWTVPEGKPVGVLKGHKKSLLGVTFSQSGKWLASTDSGGKVLVWRLADRKVIRTIKTRRGQRLITFTRKDRWLLTAAQTGTIHAWDPRTGQRLKRLVGHTSEIVDLQVTPDRRLMITAAKDNRVIIWDLSTGRPLQSMRYAMQALGAGLRPDGKAFAVTLGVPMHIYPFQPDLWKRDPKVLLDKALRSADLRLHQFRLKARR